MRVSELGEFGLIERIGRLLPSARADVVLGIGDDVAVLETSTSEYLLATCDIQVENVHFLREQITPYQLGRKTVAINVSDIAATGGTPAWGLVSLALPGNLAVEYVDALYQGMREQMLAAGASIVGGNLSRIREEIVIDFFLTGKVAPRELLLRNGAREGDAILVTGSLGDSRAGLELIRRPGLEVAEESRRFVRARHFTPQPRLPEGRSLARSGLVHAMADVSDGLLADLGHICRASGVGAEIRVGDLPVGAECEAVARAAGEDASNWALSGGEDYELLFTAAPDSATKIIRMLESETGTPCRVIGRIGHEKDGIQLVLPDGSKTPYMAGRMGWDHFAGSDA